MRGITLLEILLVMAILSILASISAGIYYNLERETALEEDENAIVASLRMARANAVSGERGIAWGVKLDNADVAQPAFILFGGQDYASAVTTEYHALSDKAVFSAPVAGQSLEIVFARRTGMTTPQTVSIVLRNNPAKIKTIQVSEEGIINR